MPLAEIYWLVVLFVLGCAVVFGLLWLALRDIADELDGRIEAVTSSQAPSEQVRVLHPVLVRGNAHQRRIARRAIARSMAGSQVARQLTVNEPIGGSNPSLPARLGTV